NAALVSSVVSERKHHALPGKWRTLVRIITAVPSRGVKPAGSQSNAFTRIVYGVHRVAVEDVITAADNRLLIFERRPRKIGAGCEVILVCREDVVALRKLRVAFIDHL